MPIAYKLTDRRGRTRPGMSHETYWGVGGSHSAPGAGQLCTGGWIHVYDSLLVGLFLDPIHGNYGQMARIWQVEWWGKTRDDCGTKRGVQHCRIIRELVPRIPDNVQRIRFAILCAAKVHTGARWRAWAIKWLNGVDRSAYTADATAYATADAAAYAAARAAYAAAADIDTAAEAAAEAAAAATYTTADALPLAHFAELAVSEQIVNLPLCWELGR